MMSTDGQQHSPRADLEAESIAHRLQALAPDIRLGLLRKMMAQGLNPGRLPILPRSPACGNPLSYAQARQWFLWQLEPDSTAYHIAGALRLTGELDVTALQQSLQALVTRHDALRTRFVPTPDGLAEPVVDEMVNLDFRLLDLSATEDQSPAADTAIRQWLQTPFDLTRDALFRVGLVRLGEQEHLLAVVMHHIISDGWSMNLIIDEFVTHYRALVKGGDEAVLAPLAIQYTDYAVWQRQWLEAGEQERQLSYWKSQLGGEQSILQLSTDYPRHADGRYSASRYHLSLSPVLSAQLRQRAQAEGGTVFMLLLAGLQVLLHRYTGQEDVRVGVPIANRHRAEMARVVGFFINTQVLRSQVHGRLTLQEVITQVRDTALGAQSHQDLPFEQLVDALQPERSLGVHPLFQVMFNHQREDRSALANLPGLTLADYPLTGQAAQFELSLDTTEHSDGSLHACFTYGEELFDPQTIARMANHYQRILEAIAQSPRQALGEVGLLAPEEQHQLQQWSVNDQYYPYTDPVHRLIEQQVVATPDAIAVVFGAEQLSYAELNRRANQLAHYLIGLGVQPDSRVGIAVERSVEMVVGLLAILKAGGAYVPLDPDYPADRLAYMVEDSGVNLLLTQGYLKGRLPVPATLECVALDTVDVSGQPMANPQVALRGEHLAYMIYTSGSTGRPKGADNRHEALFNRLCWMQEAYQLRVQDAVLQKTPFSFDVSVWEFFWPLMQGARLVVAGPGDHRDPEKLIDLIRTYNVTTLHFVPSMLQAFMGAAELHNCASLRRIICSGEALPCELQDAVLREFPQASLYNLYGPTEAAIDVTHWHCQSGVPVVIGQPISATQTYVLDREFNLSPTGVAGELYLGGTGLARGYHNRPGLTAERFIADPFTPGQRLYRTGDLARWNRAGQLEYLGRADQQVKIRGFRIEPGEVEAQLLAQSGIREAVVIARSGSAGLRLVAYLVPDTGVALDPARIREALASQMPDYMVPSIMVILEVLPLTPSGKLDRNSLPEPEQDLRSDYEAPQGPVESGLAAIWASVLGLEQVGRKDNFFELGGDSILSLQIVARARQQGWQLSPKQVFERQTLAQLALVVDTSSSPARASLTEGAVPLLPIQAEFFASDIPVRHHWNQSVLLQSRDALHIDPLRTALLALVQHHDGLRLRYRQENAAWIQYYQPLAEGYTGQDLLWIRQAQATLELEALCNETQRSLDLEQGPLLRALAVELPDSQWRLLLVAHHLVVDGVSWRILLEDLQTAYRQACAGERIALPAKSSSYLDWSNSLQEYAQTHSTELAYWQHLLNHTGSSPDIAGLPCDNPEGANTLAEQASLDLHLNADLTDALLKQVPVAYRTRINDVLLTALGRALCRWSGQPRVVIDLEGHGREDFTGTLDLSRSLGWFTSLYPVVLEPTGEPGQALCRVKEDLRSIPNQGVGYGVFRHLHNNAFTGVPPAGVIFNYLGQFDGSFSGEALWQPALESAGEVMDSRAPLDHAFNINGRIYAGELRLSVSYSRARYRADTVATWVGYFREELEQLIAHCSQGPIGITPSDFPLAGVNQAQLDELVGMIPLGNLEDLYPLSPMQQGMLFHSVYDAGAGAYLNQLCVDVDGLNVGKFRAAWQVAIERHPVLRTGFLSHTESPLQWVSNQVEVPLTIVSAMGQGDSLEQFARMELKQGFDLAKPSLMKLLLIQTAPQRHHFIWTTHHLLLDGWSASQLLGDVLRHYIGQTAMRQEGVYRDYIAWLQRRDTAASEDYWRHLLGQLNEPTKLLEVLPDSAEQVSYQAHTRVMDGQQTRQLTQVCRHYKITLNTLIQSAWALLLHRYTGREWVSFGAITAGRPSELAHSEQILGLFINTLPVVTCFKPETSVQQWLDGLQSQSLASREHEYTPLYDMQRWTAEGSQGLFDTVIVFENFPVDQTLKAFNDPSLTFSNMQSDSGNHYPLTLRVHAGEQIRMDYLHNRAQISEPILAGIVAKFEQLLRALADCDPAQLLGEFDIAKPPTELMANSGNTPDVLTRWSHWSTHTPDNIAVHYQEQGFSYRQLDQLANGIAARLVANGVGPEVGVGVLAERSPELVAGLLAVLKVGGIYIPLDPALPPPRLAYQLQDSGARVLLATDTPATDVSTWAGAIPVIPLSLDQGTTPASVTIPSVTPHAQQSAYVIYTSGSTGQPKGVCISQGALANYVESVLERLDLPASATSMAMVSTVAADLGHTVLFGALCSGRTLHLIAAEQAFDPDSFATYMDRHQVDVLKIVPSHLRALLAAAHPEQVIPRTRLVLGGEATDWALLEQLARLKPACRVLNHYGPTETTVGILTQEAASGWPGADTLPIGQPLDNSQAFVLDPWLEPVPEGVAGELYLGGSGLARGYLNRTGHTAERFVASPFTAGERLYRSGDRVRRLPDGSLEFLGRVDDQVKIRGYRVELREVAAALRAQPGIAAAEVIARAGVDGRLRLLGYLVAEEGQQINADAITTALVTRLPDYMVPSALVVLAHLPLTVNGKVDRQALPEPDASTASPTAEPPQGEKEELLAAIWCDVLGLAAIGRQDNFFQLGGDSILSLQIIARARKRGLKLSPKHLMELQTVAAVAAVAESIPTTTAPSRSLLDPISPDQPFGLTPIQHWFFEQDFAAPHHWNQSVMLEAKQPIQVDYLRQAIETVVVHHPALRTAFRRTESGWQQHIKPMVKDKVFHVVDLSRDPHALAAITSTANQFQQSLTLEQPFTSVWMELGEGKGRLLLIAHHLVVDGVSWRIILEDLQAGYAQLEAGMAAGLPTPTSSVQDWSQQLATFAQNTAVTAEYPYWLRQTGQDETRQDETSLPGNASGSNRVMDKASIQVVLDSSLTTQLLTDASKAYRTQINDLLLTAFARTLCLWVEHDSILLELEGHGREDIFDNIDLSRTLGWFTSLFPVCLTPGRAGISDSIKAVKEQLRAIPNKGLDYGVLRYLSDAGKPLAATNYPKVTFNYLGQIDQSFQQGQWQPALESAGNARDPNSLRRTWLDVGALVQDGKLKISWDYSRAIHDEATISHLANHFLKELEAVIGHCTGGTQGATPSDFPLAALTQRQLDNLPIPFANLQDVYPLSPMQQGMLFHSLYDKTGKAYLNQLRVDIEGLDVGRFTQAWQAAIDRHDILRTGFLAEGETLLQWVAKTAVLDVREHDWSSVAPEILTEKLDSLAQEQHQAMDLSQPPLMRLALIKTAANRHHLIWTSHHILLDGWSSSRVLGEILRSYQGEAPAQPAGNYRDYIHWLQQRNSGEAFWRKRLTDINGSTLLANTVSIKETGLSGNAELDIVLPELLTQRLVNFAQYERVTLNTLLQAAWAFLLSRYTGKDSVCFGATVAGRPAELRDIEQIAGLFINTLPVIGDIKPEHTMGDWLRVLQTQNLENRDYEYTPLYTINQWSGGAGQHLFDTIIVFENYPVDSALRQSVDSGLQFGKVNLLQETNYPLTLLVQQKESLSLHFLYQYSSFDKTTIAGLANEMKYILEQFIDARVQCVGDLQLVNEQSFRTLLLWGKAPGNYSSVQPVHHQFENQVAHQAQACAVICGDEQLSYTELNERANRLAHYLLAKGIKPEAGVGIATNRSIDSVVGLLAILKAGGVYVPLDPVYPAERLAYMMGDSRVQLLLVHESILATMAIPSSITPVILEHIDLTDQPVANPDIKIHGDNLAYVLYTSGSTGRPKGVAMRHQAVAELIAWQHEQSPGAWRTLLFASPCFDVGFQEVMTGLCSGGGLVQTAPDDRHDFLRLLALINQRAVSRIFLPFAVLQHFAEAIIAADISLPSLRQIITAGEQLKLTPILANWLAREAHISLINQYGPTETHVVSNFRIDNLDQELPPIGKPAAGADLWILDSYMSPVPIGVGGELYLGGAALARGYLNRPGLTAERFTANPFGCAGERLYRTGDLARWSEYGQIEYLGRVDHQVKIRGHRVEPGEVEARLLTLPGVREAIVVAQDGQGGAWLAAYVSAKTGSAIDTLRLRNEMQSLVPDYMVPTSFMLLDQLPLNSNGKVDRKALPKPMVDAATYEAPQGEQEMELARIWAEVLGVERVGRNDNFFALGGHSILAIRLLNAVRSSTVFDDPIHLHDLMRAPTISALCNRAANTPGLVALNDVHSGNPSLFCIHSGWGTSLGYLALARQLNSKFNVYCISCKALDEPSAGHKTLSAMAADYSEMIRNVQAEGPYQLLGWSLGGALVGMVMDQLEARGQIIGFAGLVDTYIPSTESLSEADANWRLQYPVFLNDISDGTVVLEQMPEDIADPLQSEQSLIAFTQDYMTHNHVSLSAGYEGATAADIVRLFVANQSLRLARLESVAALPKVKSPIHCWWASEGQHMKLKAILQREMQCVLYHQMVDADHRTIITAPQFLEDINEVLTKR